MATSPIPKVHCGECALNSVQFVACNQKQQHTYFLSVRRLYTLRWIKAIRLLIASKMSFGRVNSAFDILACAVDMHQKNPALLVIVAELSWCAWVEQTSQVFQGNHVRMPLQVVFRTCVSKLEVLEATTGDSRKLQVLKES
jgi:hypothetical protein